MKRPACTAIEHRMLDLIDLQRKLIEAQQSRIAELEAVQPPPPPPAAAGERFETELLEPIQLSGEERQLIFSLLCEHAEAQRNSAKKLKSNTVFLCAIVRRLALIDSLKKRLFRRRPSSPRPAEGSG